MILKGFSLKLAVLSSGRCNERKGSGMKYRNSISCVVAILLVAGSGAAFAQASAGLQIGVVNIGLLLQESPQAQAARESLEDEFAPRRREIVAMQTTLEEKNAAMQKDLEVMGPEERESAQRELRNDERAVVRAQNEFREDLDLRNNEAIGKIQADVLREIGAYAEAQGYDLILADGIVYASATVDVTEQILTKLQAAYEGGPGN
jgi:outer membrane protein